MNLTNIHESFWYEQQIKLLNIWSNFNERNHVATGRWEIAIASMKASEREGTYYFLKKRISNVPEKTLENELDYKDRNFLIRYSEDCGRNFQGSKLQKIAIDSGFDLKEKYSHRELVEFYNDLTCISFPHESFSKPFSEFEKVKADYGVFSEYKNYSDESKALSIAYIKEQIVFPFDYATSYQVPSFQPEAVILFMTRVREVKSYQVQPTENLSIYDKELLSGEQGIDHLFSMFIKSDEFRTWERSLNAELSVLKFRMFFESMRANKDRSNWKKVILDALPNIIRGEVTLDQPDIDADNLEQITELNILGNSVYINHSRNWNQIANELRPLFNQYKQLIPSVSKTVIELADSIANSKLANERADNLEKFKEMFANLQEPLNSLTDALSQTQKDSQDLRNILYPLDKSLFFASTLTEKYFEEDSRKSFFGVEWESFHNVAHIEKKEDFFALGCSIGVLIFILLGTKEPKGKMLSEEEFYARVEDSIMQEISSPTKIGKLTIDILSPSGDIREFLNELGRCINNPVLYVNNNVQKPTLLKDAFKILKSILFTPFKYVSDTPLSAIAVLLHDINDDFILLEGITVRDALIVSSKARRNIFDLSELPCLRYCNLIALFSGIISWARNQEDSSIVNKGTVIERTSSKIQVKLNFDREIFQMDKIPELFDLMSFVIKDRFNYPHGNFRKPFLDFALSVRHKYRKPNSLQLISNDSACQHSIVIKGDEWDSILQFRTDSFTFIIGKKGCN
ncbi:MAG: hypothetical protein COB83_04035 [Gammaproteobacteria bacterium]|nr:MAG: hypothetical protein COB83_04035 [Gammaproteobacteria bacterium]